MTDITSMRSLLALSSSLSGAALLLVACGGVPATGADLDADASFSSSQSVFGSWVSPPSLEDLQRIFDALKGREVRWGEDFNDNLEFEASEAIFAADGMTDIGFYHDVCEPRGVAEREIFITHNYADGLTIASVAIEVYGNAMLSDTSRFAVVPEEPIEEPGSLLPYRETFGLKLGNVPVPNPHPLVGYRNRAVLVVQFAEDVDPLCIDLLSEVGRYSC